MKYFETISFERSEIFLTSSSKQYNLKGTTKTEWNIGDLKSLHHKIQNICSVSVCVCSQNILQKYDSETEQLKDCTIKQMHN